MTITLAVTSSLLGFIAAALCALAGWRLRDTTFAAPCAWAAAALAGLASVETAPFLFPLHSHTLLIEHLHYLTGVTVVAPFVALLGAKRPQNMSWQWIVLALIVLLAFQDLRSWFIESAAPSPHAAWRWLLAAVVTMQFCNYLPTSYYAPAGLAFAGQLCVLAGYLPLLPEYSRGLVSVGIITLSAAVISAGMIRQFRRQPADAWNATWLDFRDLFGALWALRACQRVNALLEEQRCALRVTWYGVSPSQSEVDERSSSAPPDISDRVALHRILRPVLSRFLAAAWFPQKLETTDGGGGKL
jgi:hypothetical protein